MRRTSKLLLTLGDGTGSLHRRLYRRMRGLILDGSWPVGTKLPSSRVLAEELGVSRNTALHAVELLVADGWVHSRPGAAMYVSSDAPTPVPHLGMAQSIRPAPRKPVPFEVGRHTAEFFPRERWNRLQTKMWAEPEMTMLYGADAGGWPALCRAIAAYLGASRGLAVDPDHVIVFSSTQAAIDLVTRVMGEEDDAVWIEDPGYPLAHQLFRLNGLSPVPVPVDEEGMRVADGVIIAPEARFAYVTPACQFPTGRPMSAARRRELLAWASGQQGWIIEDDWEWHAYFDGLAVHPPLRSLPGGDRVIYMQTFNRTIFPGLRMAFLVAPPAWASKLLETHERVDGGPNVPVQATLARFLDDGLYAAHLRVTRTAYAERRTALLNALESLPAGFEARDDRAGLHLIVDIPSGLNDARLAAEARAAGIACMGIGEFALAESRDSGLVLGFAAFEPAELTAAAARLIDTLRRAGSAAYRGEISSQA